ncbi:transcription termination factor Rho [Nocardioides dubius]|uniref:Transcription termination factor Rho n=1 Tax=Nocardioides dubius TaxID=317019 RepID=A0ABN1TJQ7_9ACTN
MTDAPQADAVTEGAAPAAAKEPKKRSGGLNGMLLADLKAMAAGLGIPGSASMKKAQLVEAIRGAGTPVAKGQRSKAEKPAAEKSAGEKPAPATSAPAGASAVEAAPRQAAPERERQAPSAEQGSAQAEQPALIEVSQRRRQRGKKAVEAEQAPVEQAASEGRNREARDGAGGGNRDGRDGNRSANRGEQGQSERGQRGEQGKQGRQQEQAKQEQGKQEQGKQSRQGQDQGDGKQEQSRQQSQQSQQDQHDDGEGGSRNRRRRGRDRDRSGRQRNEPDTTILEDDVLVPAAGILDVLDNYAFVRTTGYLPGAEDVYLSLSMVRKFGLRRGDAVVGQVRQPREGERREKFNPMVRVDAVNGADPELAAERSDFAELTPVHPTERLRLETDAANVAGRMIDLVAPIGKGQRGLVVAPARSGKTTLLQSIADSVAANHPECHLMVVLVDERPEEVTDFQRSVKGEVIASTFDLPATDHIALAELALERAKRLVELGHDVVVLLDGVTRLVRAYNLAAPAGGRILAGGLDVSALNPPKRLFGAARNVEHGGSLTILATAGIDSVAEADAVILDEFEGTANLEVRLRRDLAEAGQHPAIDVTGSSTRREELLLSEEERAALGALRAKLAGSDAVTAATELATLVRGTQSNVQLLSGLTRR